MNILVIINNNEFKEKLYDGESIWVSNDKFKSLIIGVNPVPAAIHINCEQLNNLSILNVPQKLLISISAPIRIIWDYNW